MGFKSAITYCVFQSGLNFVSLKLPIANLISNQIWKPEAGLEKQVLLIWHPLINNLQSNIFFMVLFGCNIELWYYERSEQNFLSKLVICLQILNFLKIQWISLLIPKDFVLQQKGKQCLGGNTFLLLFTLSLWYSKVWQYRLWSFERRDTKNKKG